MNLVLRLFLVAAGLLFAASLAIALVLMLALWSLRAVWARLTGRPLAPFVVGIDPRSGFDRMYRRAGAARATNRGYRVRPSPKSTDVTDVEPRPPG